MNYELKKLMKLEVLGKFASPFTIRPLLCFLLLFLTASITFAQQDTACMPVREFTAGQLSFHENERLTIVATYKWGIINTDVGEATMMLTKEKFRDTTYFYARAYAKTYRFYDNFFMVRDVYEARFLSSNLRPLYFHRNISEGGYTIKNTYVFNNADYTIRASVQRKTGAAKDTVLPGKSCTFDFVSLFYNSRNLDFDHFQKDQIIPISFAVDEELFHIYYRYIGKEEKKISGLGTFKCIKIAAKPVAGEVFDGKNEISIWISDDKNHIPLLIETPVIVGKVSARLSKYANLKHPLSSKVQ
ncbi:MAG: DUF3108 domain-containing protein [Prevotellaceae bacterium]|jgi:hypothetical protein|nr:DUF3108 domain-containing protein [Prevotellaceae bacterium]